ncbi:MAG TPA: M20/M25/M40 family metallo-hydrolase [Gemmatimonadaceae bacterium]|nr:M20/M25/M40 family metallo-hydrolase [Gemmatimonadaceae bacterium]
MPVPSRPHAEFFAALAPLRERLAAADDALLRTQVAIAQVPAPTGDEGERAALLRQRFEAIGLHDVRVDEAGNVIGRRPGRRAIAPVAVCAHLDTVFSRAIPHVVRCHGVRYEGPSITDNSRGLAVMLAIAEAMGDPSLAPERSVDFVGTTGEEGNGDLRGAKHFFARAPERHSAMIAVDGAGDQRIIHRALGARRYRVSFDGPGGHSWSAFGAPNAIHAAAGATARLAAIPLSREPRTTLSVGRIGGGTSVNAIPDQAWLELDVRSTGTRALDRMETEVHRAISAAVDDENARRARDTRALTAHVTRIGDRPGGETDAAHPLVEAASAFTRLSGRDPELAVASTDANVPIGLGIPAIAIGAGGRGGDAHAPTEWFENVDGPRGVARALAIVLYAAQSPAG